MGLNAPFPIFIKLQRIIMQKMLDYLKIERRFLEKIENAKEKKKKLF